jgi:hypothetical protein
VDINRSLAFGLLAALDAFAKMDCSLTDRSISSQQLRFPDFKLEGVFGRRTGLCILCVVCVSFGVIFLVP